MATPPFTIATTTPADNDLISVFPGAERPYRDVVWSWLNLIASPTTGLLKSSAFPANVTSWVIQALDGTSDASLSFNDNSGVLQSKVLWDHTNDQLSLIGYQDDGTTIRTRLDVKGDTAVVNVATGALQVGGVAVVLTSYAGVLSGLTGTGAMTSGSIGSGFGAINIGSNTLTAGAGTFSGAVSGTTGTFSGAVSGTTITGSGAVQGTNLVTTSNIVANSGAATMNFRPSGPASTTGQMTLTASGTLTAAGDITASSDRRLKKSISPLNHQWANDMVAEVQPMTYLFKKNDRRGIGFIAQDVEGYAPELVYRDPRGMRSLAYPNMVAILWAVVQDLQKKVAELEAK